MIRPAVDAWASKRTKLAAAQELTAAGIVAGPSNHAPDVIADPHVAARHMLVEMPRTDGVDEPVLVPGNPVKLSKMAEGPETRVPWVGSTPTSCWAPSSASLPPRSPVCGTGAWSRSP